MKQSKQQKPPKLSEEDEEAKVEEYKRQLEEDDKEKAEKLAAIAKKFDPKQVLKSAREIQRITDEQLGEIRYGMLSLKEINELPKEPDIQKRAFQVLYAMLHKGYPDLTFEEFEALPFDIAARLSQLLSERFTGFLQRQKK